MKAIKVKLYIPIIRKKSPDTPIYTGEFNILLPFEPVLAMIFYLPTWDNQLIILKTVEITRYISSDYSYGVTLESITQIKFSRIKYSFDQQNRDYEKYEVNLVIPQLNLQTKIGKEISLNPIPGIYLLTVEYPDDTNKIYFTEIKKTTCNFSNQTINIELFIDKPSEIMKQAYIDNGWSEMKK